MSDATSPFPPPPTAHADDTPSFQDSERRTWFVRLNIGRVRIIRDATGVDFGRIEDGRFFLQLGGDPERFAQVMARLRTAG